jgi:hypothetical protein
VPQRVKTGKFLNGWAIISFSKKESASCSWLIRMIIVFSKLIHQLCCWKIFVWLYKIFFRMWWRPGPCTFEMEADNSFRTPVYIFLRCWFHFVVVIVHVCNFRSFTIVLEINLSYNLNILYNTYFIISCKNAEVITLCYSNTRTLKSQWRKHFYHVYLTAAVLNPGAVAVLDVE